MDDITRYIETMNRLQDAINPPAIRAIQEQYDTIQNATEIIAERQNMEKYAGLYETITGLSSQLSRYDINLDAINYALSSMTYFTNTFYEQEQIISNITQALHPILDGYTVLGLHPKSRNKKQKKEADQISEKIISEIYLPDEKKIITAESPTITILPANDKIFAYLAEHPEEIYRNLSPREFEEFMARLYNKLGYNVELTQTTRDGGKDIILRKPDVLGDMIYYVECKRYKEKNKVGLDVVQRLTGIVETDKVNGGIIATTSYLSPSAERWIIENRYNYKIQMHNFKTIQNMLKMTVA